MSCVSSFRSKSCEDFAIDVKDLDSMIVGIAHDDSIGVTDGDVMRVFKITGFATHHAKLPNKRPISLENLEIINAFISNFVLENFLYKSKYWVATDQ